MGRLHNYLDRDLRHLHFGAVERRVGLLRQPLRVRLPAPTTGKYQPSVFLEPCSGFASKRSPATLLLRAVLLKNDSIYIYTILLRRPTVVGKSEHREMLSNLKWSFERLNA